MTIENLEHQNFVFHLAFKVVPLVIWVMKEKEVLCVDNWPVDVITLHEILVLE